MPKYATIVVLLAVIVLAVFSVYAQRSNNLSLTELNSALSNIQVQVNRGFNQQLSELSDEQKKALQAAKQKVWEARKQLIDTELEIGLLTKEEAQYFRDHIDLMAKYGQDYDPPAWGLGHMGRGGPGMMNRW